jgi:hypothetical protein
MTELLIVHILLVLLSHGLSCCTFHAIVDTTSHPREFAHRPLKTRRCEEILVAAYWCPCWVLSPFQE